MFVVCVRHIFSTHVIIIRVIRRNGGLGNSPVLSMYVNIISGIRIMHSISLIVRIRCNISVGSRVRTSSCIRSHIGRVVGVDMLGVRIRHITPMCNMIMYITISVSV